jgi:hypothetical protein
MSEVTEKKVFRAGVVIGNFKHPIGLSGSSLTEEEAQKKAAEEEIEYNKLGIEAKGVVVEDTHPPKWLNNQNVGH